MNFRLPTLLCILLLAGCHKESTATRTEEPARVATSITLSWMKTEVFFGRDIPGGGTVSDAEWTDFLDKTVTPQFPQGFTVTDTQGNTATTLAPS